MWKEFKHLSSLTSVRTLGALWCCVRNVCHYHLAFVIFCHLLEIIWNRAISDKNSFHEFFCFTFFLFKAEAEFVLKPDLPEFFRLLFNIHSFPVYPFLLIFIHTLTILGLNKHQDLLFVFFYSWTHEYVMDFYLNVHWSCKKDKNRYSNLSYGHMIIWIGIS